MAIMVGDDVDISRGNEKMKKNLRRIRNKTASNPISGEDMIKLEGVPPGYH